MTMTESMITVRGTGHVSLRPDLTVVTMTLKSLDPEYDRAMAQSSEQQSRLENALASVGFAGDDLITVHFNVQAEHESVRDDKGNYKSVFRGYSCVHELKLEFDFDSDRLSQVLSAVSRSVADPELQIRFTVRDKSAVSEALLTSAAANAREKAEILCRASGKTLGELVSIDYSFGDRELYSETEFAMDRKCMAVGNAVRIRPENIDMTDSATFVWRF